MRVVIYTNNTQNAEPYTQWLSELILNACDKKPDAGLFFLGFQSAIYIYFENQQVPFDRGPRESYILTICDHAARELGNADIHKALYEAMQRYIKQTGKIPPELQNFAADNPHKPKTKPGNNLWRNEPLRASVTRQFYQWRKDTGRLKLPQNWDIWRFVTHLQDELDQAEKADCPCSDNGDKDFFNEPLPAKFNRDENRSLKAWYKEGRRRLIMVDMLEYCLNYWLDYFQAMDAHE